MSMSQIFDRFGRLVIRRNGVLQDGDRVTTPVSLMDNAHRTMIRDVGAPPVLHKPGMIAPDHNAAERTRMYAESDKALEGAWKTPPAPAATAPVTKIVAPPNDVEAAHKARDEWLQNAWKRPL